jgi:uncharacterized OB-fold protein
MPAEIPKPRPVPVPTSQPFWDALRDERVVIQRCAECSTWVHYPRVRCTACLSDRLEWHTVSGAGSIFTFTVTRQPSAVMFADEVPQIIAVIELDEGVHLTTTISDAEPAAVRCGARVSPVFDHGSDGTTLLRYRLA